MLLLAAFSDIGDIWLGTLVYMPCFPGAPCGANLKYARYNLITHVINSSLFPEYLVLRNIPSVILI